MRAHKLQRFKPRFIFTFAHNMNAHSVRTYARVSEGKKEDTGHLTLVPVKSAMPDSRYVRVIKKRKKKEKREKKRSSVLP